MTNAHSRLPQGEPCLKDTGFPGLFLQGCREKPHPGQHLTPQSGPAHLVTPQVLSVQILKSERHHLSGLALASKVHDIHSLCGADPRLPL